MTPIKQHDSQAMLTAYCEQSRWCMTEDQVRYWCLRHAVDQYAHWRGWSHFEYVTDHEHRWWISCAHTPIQERVSQYRCHSWYALTHYEDHVMPQKRGYENWLEWWYKQDQRVQKWIRLCDPK